MPKNRKYNKKRKSQSKALTRAQYNAVKRIDTRMEFKRSPTLRVEKSHNGFVSPTDVASTVSALQCPYQDLIVGLGSSLDQNQRLGAVIYPQALKFTALLTRKTGDTDMQRFRIMVVRYLGEMDFSVNNSAYNGFDLQSSQWAHVCRPGEIWSAKPYVKNQIKVLYDKTYLVNDSNKSGCLVKFSIPIKRKLTYEATTAGANAVGAGQIVIMISSDKNYNIQNYNTYAMYKDLQ